MVDLSPQLHEWRGPFPQSPTCAAGRLHAYRASTPTDARNDPQTPDPQKYLAADIGAIGRPQLAGPARR